MSAVIRAQSVALIASRDIENDFRSYWRPQVFSVDEHGARRAAASFIEGNYLALLTVAEMLGLPWPAQDAFCRKHAATYTQIRNWLHGDLEFTYTIACRVALAFSTHHHHARD